MENNTSEQLKIQIFTGPLDQDWVVAEIYYGDELLAEISEWGGKLKIYPRENGQSWILPTKDVIEILKKARERVESN